MSGPYLSMNDFQTIDDGINALDSAEVVYDPRGGVSGDNCVIVRFTCDDWSKCEKLVRDSPPDLTEDIKMWSAQR